MLKAMQIGMNSLDLAGSLRLYSALGFSNAGSQTVWGDLIRIQGLPPESRALVWFMVGAQPLFQLELFQHSWPKQRALPDDWRPSDHGWTRIGIAVADYDRCLAVLDCFGIPLLGGPKKMGGDGRHAAFRDPFIGVIVEMVEGDAGAAGPMILYAAASVSDLEAARAFYQDAVQLPIESTTLRPAEDEALWGVKGAEREGFIVRAGPIYLEVARYVTPVGRPRRTDYRASDQGIVNVMFGTHDVAEMAATFERLKVVGLEPPHLLRLEGLLAGYIIDREREIELSAVPAEILPEIGFMPAGAFLDDALNQSG